MHEAAALPLGLKLKTLEARTPKDFEIAFQSAARDRAGALLVLVWWVY